MPEFTSPLYQRVSNAVNGNIRGRLIKEATGTALPSDMALIVVDLLTVLFTSRIVNFVLENGTDVETEVAAISDDFIRGTMIVCSPGYHPAMDNMTLQ